MITAMLRLWVVQCQTTTGMVLPAPKKPNSVLMEVMSDELAQTVNFLLALAYHDPRYRQYFLVIISSVTGNLKKQVATQFLIRPTMTTTVLWKMALLALLVHKTAVNCNLMESMTGCLFPQFQRLRLPLLQSQP